jgi:hypothetical protein
VLRHVAKLAAAPVIVDRPGGVVHSERELRIILPVTGDVKADEAVAVAVEFGVLRGMLDLVTPPASLTDKSAAGSGGAQSGGKKNLWTMFRAAARAARNRSGVVLLAGCLLGAAGIMHASPRPGSPAGTPTLTKDRFTVTTGMLAFPASKFSLTAVRIASPANMPVSPVARRVVEARGVDGAYLHLEAALAPAPAQGQFAAGELNIALIGGAAVSSSLYDSGNTALKVNCVVGCGTTSTFSDNAAFSAGSTAVNNISAVFNDSIAALTSGNAGAVRSTSDTSTLANLGAPLFLVLTSLIAGILLFVSIVLLGVQPPQDSRTTPPSPRARRRKPASAAYTTTDSRPSLPAMAPPRGSQRRGRST